MAKFHGIIGYAKTVESVTNPGVWEEQIIEKSYKGDLIKNISKFNNAGEINDDIVLLNNFSIIADPYACENFMHMKYIKYMDIKLKISSAEVQYPRILISVGGIYNE